ncbi:arylamine N-acetyltransferase [Streptomyces sp. NPDC050504]|uniref:arylamine N-acetyltransferase n=1 Tax=Streptomyces sp. NPDC050504 TaxID=3365618 RepID=UPI0037A6CC8A
MWHGDAFDLDAYLARLGYEGDRTPTLETLRALHRAHVLTLRWENIDAVLRQDVDLALDRLQAKLVDGARGGYCYEHVLLYAAALERIGFAFHGIQGRVQMGAEQARPKTHAMLLIEVDGKRWLSDVGFGTSPLVPIELTDSTDVSDGVWRYRLRRREITPGADGYALYHPAREGETDNTGDGWTLRHTFTLAPHYPVDYRVGNHYVASNPHSPFSHRLFVQRIHPDRQYVLDNRTLYTLAPGAEPSHERRELEATEVPKVLADVFGIELTPEDAELLLTKLV